MAEDLEAVRARYEKLKSVLELAASISHEMNQALTGISGYCALIKEELDESHPTYKDILQIETQASRLEELVNKFQGAVSFESSNNNKSNKSNQKS